MFQLPLSFSCLHQRSLDGSYYVLVVHVHVLLLPVEFGIGTSRISCAILHSLTTDLLVSYFGNVISHFNQTTPVHEAFCYGNTILGSVIATYSPTTFIGAFLANLFIPHFHMVLPNPSILSLA